MKKYTYKELKDLRKTYSNVEWMSTGGKSSKIVEMDSDYLTNVLSIVHSKNMLAKAYPLVDSFQQWNNISYSKWCEIIYTELQYRDESSYEEYLDNEMYKSMQHDKKYYEDDRYDIGAYGDCF